MLGIIEMNVDLLPRFRDIEGRAAKQGIALGQNRQEFKTFMEFARAYFVDRGIEHPLVVEIGVLWGGQKQFYKELLNAEHIGIDNNRDGCSTPDILGDSHDEKTITILKEKLTGRPIDLLFLDGDHAYESVKKDYENYGPLTRHLIAFHDINTSNWVGNETIEVNRLWNELVEEEKDCTYITFRNFNKPEEFRGFQMGIGLMIKEPRTMPSRLAKPRHHKPLNSSALWQVCPRLISTSSKKQNLRQRHKTEVDSVKIMLSNQRVPVLRMADLREGPLEALDNGSLRINVCIPSIGRGRIFDAIDTFLQSNCANFRVTVVMQEDEAQADRVRDHYAKEPTVEVIFEKERKGWVWAQNLIASRPGCLFAAGDDIAVLRDTLRTLEVAMQTIFPDTDCIITPGMTQTNWPHDESGMPRPGWGGAFPLIGHKFIERFPERLVFCPDYFGHGADPELYHYAISVNRYVQSLDAKLIHFHPRPEDVGDDKTSAITAQRAKEAIDITAKRHDRGYLWGKNYDLLRPRSH
jgi:hypothetical protein